MAKTIVGLFDTMNEAQTVVQELVNNGFNRNEISLVANNATGEHGNGNTTTGGTTEDRGGHAAEGAGTGAVGGTVVGGVIGLLVGIGALAIPGIGPVLAAGPIAAALGSTALGAGIGAAAGGLVGALVGAGVPEEEANYYSEGVRRGGTLVTVASDDAKAQTAYDIFQRAGAVDIKQRGAEYKQSGFSRFDPNAQPYNAQEINQFRTSRSTTTGTATAPLTGSSATSTRTTTTDTTTTGGQSFTSGEFRDNNQNSTRQ